MLQTLALSDTWQIGIVLAQMLFNAGGGIAMFVLAQRTQQFARLEEQMKSSAERLIDQKFVLLAQRMEASIDRFREAIEAINARLRQGDEDFEQIRERNHQIELKLLKSVNDLQQYMREHGATKESVQKLFEEQKQMGQAIARYARNAGGV